MKITNLVFDLYGTLVDIHTRQDLPEVWEKTALYFGFQGAAYEPEELKDRFQALTASGQADAGQSCECFPELSMALIFASLFEEKGVCKDVELLAANAAQLFRIQTIEYIRLYSGVKEALGQLREKGCGLWLLSNAQRLFTACELRLLKLEDCFDGIYISSDYGFRKPDPRFFQALLAQSKLKPESCLMIGNDLTCDIFGARKAGMHTFYIHSGLSPQEDSLVCDTLLSATAVKNQQNNVQKNLPDYAVEGADWHMILPALLKILQRGM